MSLAAVKTKPSPSEVPREHQARSASVFDVAWGSGGKHDGLGLEAKVGDVATRTILQHIGMHTSRASSAGISK